tara:strand:- start:58 stop:309 length:252 start_codon:yes stop_codon:yes gene_type:complete
MIDNLFCSYLATQEGDLLAIAIFLLVAGGGLINTIYCGYHCLTDWNISTFNRQCRLILIIFVPIIGAIIYQLLRLYFKKRSKS